MTGKGGSQGKGRTQDHPPQKKDRQTAVKRNTFPWINSQIIALSDAGDLRRLLSTIEAHKTHMNLVNISTALHRLAKMAAGDGQAYAELERSHVIEALMAAARAALARATTAPSNQALSNITWAMATLQRIDVPLLQAVAGPAAANLQEFKTFELSAILWAFAKIGAANPTAAEISRRVFEVAAGHIPDHLEDFSFRCLVTTVWAFATAKYPSVQVFRGAAVFMVGMVHTANCQELANTAWAFSTAGVHHERLFASVAKKALYKLHAFKPQELSNILWGFASMGFFHEAFFVSAASTAQLMTLNAQHLANILWSLTRVRPQHAATHQALLALLPECTRQLWTFKPQEVASVALAAAKVFGRSGDRAANDLSDAGNQLPPPPAVLHFFAQAAHCILPQLHLASARSLANLASSFLAVRAESAVVLLASIGQQVLRLIHSLGPAVLLQLIRAFSADLSPWQLVPYFESTCRTVSQALYQEAARCLDSFKPRELQLLSQLCAEQLRCEDWAPHHPNELRRCCLKLATAGAASAPASMPSVLDGWLDAAEVDGGEELAGAAGGLHQAGGSAAMRRGGEATVRQEEVATGPLEPLGESRCGRGGSDSDSPTHGAYHQATDAADDGQASDQGEQLGLNELRFPGRYPDSRRLPGRNPNFCSIKNTFLHVDEVSLEEEDEETLDPSSVVLQGKAGGGVALGPPLGFLPKYIEPSELEAYRADYQAFRAGQATGARGEISNLAPSARELKALGLEVDERLVLAARERDQ